MTRFTHEDSLKRKKWSMAAYGDWELANDGARTNGGGIVGDITLTNQAAAFAKTFDASEGSGTLGNIAVSGARAGYAANFQLFPDSPAATDYVAFGAAIPFCEVSFLAEGGVSAQAVYDEAAVTEWQYWDGDSWETLAIATDQTDTDDSTSGDRPFQQDGALSFVPPADWAELTLDGQAAFWIRSVVETDKGDNMTTVPILDAVEHDVVTPNDGFTCSHGGTITGIRIVDSIAEGSEHSGSTVKFIVMNFTTGDHSGELEWATTQRQDAFTGLTLTVNQDDVLAPLVTQEDSGDDDPTNVMLELQVSG